MRFVAQAVAIGTLTVCGLGYGRNFSRAEVVAFLPEDDPIRFTQDGRRLVTLYHVSEGGRQTVQAYRLEGNRLVLEAPGCRREESCEHLGFAKRKARAHPPTAGWTCGQCFGPWSKWNPYHRAGYKSWPQHL